LRLILIDFIGFLKLNTILKLKIKKNKEFESNYYVKTFQKIYDQSINNPEKFWQEASNDIFWFKKPTKILNKSNPPFYKWFEDGVTNTCYNALDIHIDQGRGKKTALIYDSPITGNKSQFSYDELRSKVSKFAGASKRSRYR
jgi:propionyl-CoA synthetase